TLRSRCTEERYYPVPRCETNQLVTTGPAALRRRSRPSPPSPRHHPSRPTGGDGGHFSEASPRAPHDRAGRAGGTHHTASKPASRREALAPVPATSARLPDRDQGHA